MYVNYIVNECRGFGAIGRVVVAFDPSSNLNIREKFHMYLLINSKIEKREETGVGPSLKYN